MPDPTDHDKATARNLVIEWDETMQAAGGSRVPWDVQRAMLIKRVTDALARVRDEERESVASEMEGKVLPVLESCQRLFGGQGFHGPGALEDDCAFAIRIIRRLRQRTPGAAGEEART